MKKSAMTIGLAAVFGALMCSIATGTGLPTFDAATVAQLQQQYQQMKQQYDTLRLQYAAATGSYGRGQFALADSVKSSSAVPGSWQEVVSMQASGAYGTKSGYYDKLLKTMPQELFQDPKAQPATTYKLSTDSVRAAMTGGELLYSEVQVHLNALARLSQQVDSTVNVKDAQDLQNRIAAESGMLQTALAKVNTLNMNLQANLVNQQNQATAETLRYFGRTAK